MRRLYANPEAERRIQERLETRLTARYERALRRELRQASIDAANAYRQSGLIESAIASHDSVIERALTGMYEAAYTLVGGRVATALDNVKGWRPERKSEEMSDVFRVAMERFVRRWTARRVVDISSTTRSQVADIINRGIEEGLVLDQLAGLIAQRGTELAGYRANLIARTEIHSAANAGALEAAQESGVVALKEWIAVEDARTRDGDNSDFDHINVEPVPINSPFIVSGEELMFPGDPAGSAGNIINCRCAMGYIVD